MRKASYLVVGLTVALVALTDTSIWWAVGFVASFGVALIDHVLYRLRARWVGRDVAEGGDDRFFDTGGEHQGRWSPPEDGEE